MEYSIVHPYSNVLIPATKHNVLQLLITVHPHFLTQDWKRAIEYYGFDVPKCVSEWHQVILSMDPNFAKVSMRRWHAHISYILEGDERYILKWIEKISSVARYVAFKKVSADFYVGHQVL